MRTLPEHPRLERRFATLHDQLRTIASRVLRRYPAPSLGPDDLLQFCEPRTITENTLRRGFAPSEEVAEVLG